LCASVGIIKSALILLMHGANMKINNVVVFCMIRFKMQILYSYINEREPLSVAFLLTQPIVFNDFRYLGCTLRISRARREYNVNTKSDKVLCNNYVIFLF
jgi:hypothetical protein